MGKLIIEDKEVKWDVIDIPVHGTVTAPKDKDPHPVVILVAGSGPTDRNWCTPYLPGTNGSGKLMAEALAAQGFITIRYDKMASGPHAKENIPKFTGKINMQTHMDELAGAVQAVVAETNIDGDALFALTNSEGAIHAVNYQLAAKDNRFKGLVLTGAPGRSVGDVGRSQIIEQIRPMPDAETIIKHYDKAIEQFLANEPMVIDPSLPDGLKGLLRALENPCNLPFARELWNYGLPQFLARIEEPILVVIGKKDIQIDWRIDGGALEKATAKKSAVQFAYPENANHVLKHEEMPRDKLTAQYVGLHYNAPDAELDHETVDTIVDWLKRTQLGG
jgi:uncharacterized protein